VALALGALAQINQFHIRLPDDPDRFPCGRRPTESCDLLLMEADLHIGGNGDIHHLRVGELQVAHQLDIFLDRLTCRRG
jgi:hypothetical protein